MEKTSGKLARRSSMSSHEATVTANEPSASVS